MFHRDLKPGNVMLTRSGVALLDFGLARMGLGGSAPEPLDQDDARLTREGTIVGTLHYLSPEQLNGGMGDGRSDIFALGAVLYEMLTAQRAFEGASQAMVIAAILERDPPPVSDIQRTAPRALDRVIGKALAKDPDARWQHPADLRDELKWIAEDASTASATSSVAARLETRKIVSWVLLAAAGLALAILSAVYVSRQPATRTSPPHTARTTMASSGTAALAVARARSLAITPDGTRVIYTGRDNQLFVRALDRLDATPIVTGAAPLNYVFVSPDGQRVGFAEGNFLKMVAVTGGPPVTIVQTGGLFGATWAPQDTIIFATSEPANGLRRVSAAGGEVSELTRPAPARGELGHRWPEMLPGGRAVLFTIVATTGGLAAAQVAVLDLAAGTYTVLVPGGSHAHYVPSGHLVYVAEGALRAVAFDLTRLQTRGTPVTVLPRIVTTPRGSADFVVAADGTLAYVDAPDASAAAARTLVWVDRRGREEALAAPPRPYLHPRVSPDGTRVAVAIEDQENDIWVWDLARRTLGRLTFESRKRLGSSMDAGRASSDLLLDAGARAGAALAARRRHRHGPEALHRRACVRRDAGRHARDLRPPREPGPGDAVARRHGPRPAGTADGVRRAQRRRLTERPLAGLRIGRLRAIRDLRPAVPRRQRGAMADLDGRRHAAALGPERPGAVLCRTRRRPDGRAGRPSRRSVERGQPGEGRRWAVCDRRRP